MPDQHSSSTNSSDDSSLSPELRQKILDFVYHPQYQPSKPKAIHKAIKLPPEAYPQTRMTIKRLVRAGQLAYAGNHLVLTPEQISGDDKTTRGTFRQAAAGFGFLRPVPTGQLGPVDDIFIPASQTGSAMDGDLVQIRLRSSRRGSGQEGAVTEIIERARRQFAGTYAVSDGQSVVYLDATTVSEPVNVGDVRGLPVEVGDKVIVELVQFPEGASAGEGVILEVLGSSKNPAVDTLAVMRHYGLQEEFPEEVIEQARQAADQFVEGEIPSDRRDLTQVPTLTIDPHDARDFDDAISLSRNEKGNWELSVHIADVAHFVPLASTLDEEARQRATSVYLPDRVIPMLPELISNHLASLQPDKVRMTKTVLMEMSATGTVLHQEVFNSAIHNDCRLNYEQVDQFIDDPQQWRERLEPATWQLLSDMLGLAMVLRGNRVADGALELHLPEVKVDLDKSGKVRGARVVEHTQSHQVIEEFMLAANQAVATWLDDLEIPFLRRAHAPPERRRMQKLNEFMRDLGIKCESMENRFEVQRIVNQVRGKPTEYAVNYAILKSMSKAVYQPEMEMHYALHFDHYCHFTSPIRRYPDLQVHRTVDRLIRQQQPAGDPLPVLVTLGQHCSDKEQNAEWAEREITRIKLLHFLNKKIGENMPGVISKVVPEGFFVRGTQLPVEGFVSIKSLPSDRYRFEKRGQSLEGFRGGNRYRLGDSMTVKIDRVDLMRRELVLTVVSNHTAKGEYGAAKRASTGKGESTKSTQSKKYKKPAKRKNRRRK